MQVARGSIEKLIEATSWEACKADCINTEEKTSSHWKKQGKMWCHWEGGKKKKEQVTGSCKGLLQMTKGQHPEIRYQKSLEHSKPDFSEELLLFLLCWLKMLDPSSMQKSYLAYTLALDLYPGTSVCLICYKTSTEVL